MKKIRLDKNNYAIVDDDDYKWLSAYNWCLQRGYSSFYAIRNNPQSKPTTITMHRQILGLNDSRRTDHINGNGLDNRRSNLRISSAGQNRANSKPNKGRRFKGVHYRNAPNSYGVQITTKEKRIWIGTSKTEIGAARMYDIAARKHHGKFAKLNFPEENKNEISK